MCRQDEIGTRVVKAMRVPGTSERLSSHEFNRLQSEYAWTIDEASRYLGLERFQSLLNAQELSAAPTSIGTLILIGAKARQRTGSSHRSADTQLDRAYRRLACQAFGWSKILNPARREQIQRHSSGGHLLAIQTDDGAALLGARLIGNGYSPEHIRKLAIKLKSSALGDDFNLVFVTPGRRGQAYCAQRDHFMQWFHFHPVVGTTVLPWLTKTPPSHSSEEPYLAGESWRTDSRFATLPEDTLALLQRPRSARIEAAIRSLHLDLVITERQLLRYYGLYPSDIPNALTVERLTRFTPSQRTRASNVVFMVATKRLQNLHTSRLAHLAGSTQIRHQLSLETDPKSYQLVTTGAKRDEQPDAIYTLYNGKRFALEYDSGAYKELTIWRKIDSFKTQNLLIIWGVTSRKRGDNLKMKFNGQLANSIFLLDWP